MTWKSLNQRHHCSITVSSLFNLNFCQMVLCHQQMHNHTPKELQKDRIRSMTSQKLENDKKEPKSKASLFHHCLITVRSLFRHCFFFKWSCVTKHSARHCKRIKYDQWHLKTTQMTLKFSNQRHHCSITVALLFDHCCITVPSLFLSKGLVSPNKLPRHCKRIKHDQMPFKNLEDNVKKLKSKASNNMKEPKSKASLFHHCSITVSSLFDHCICHLCLQTHPQGIAKG
jgi:hypothetical protein